MNNFCASEIIGSSRRIFEDLDMSGMIKNGFTQSRLGYSNSYKYYKLPFHRVKPVRTGSAARLKVLEDLQECRVYISVPFCLNRCQFCFFHGKMKGAPGVAQRYEDYLFRELDLLSGAVELKRIALGGVYFGGGTPTCLSCAQFKNIIGCLKDKFRKGGCGHLSLEADPNTLVKKEGYEKLSYLNSLGFTRISIGFQEMDDAILGSIGRLHSAKDNIEAFWNARQAGFKYINCDLMFGLPGQTMESWLVTLGMVAKLQPESVDLYRLRFDGYSGIYKRFVSSPGIFPSSSELWLMKVAAKEFFSNIGYEEKNPNLFQKDGRAGEHPFFNNTRSCIGLGAGARGVVRDVVYYNEDGVKYLKKIDKGALPLFKIMKLSAKQLMERRVISSLVSMDEGISRDSFRADFGKSIEEEFGPQLKRLFSLGLIEGDGRIKFTYKGSIFYEDVFRAFCRQGILERCLTGLSGLQIKRTAVMALNYKNRIRGH